MSRIIQPRPKKDWCGCGTGEIYGDGFCKPCLIKHATKALEKVTPERSRIDPDNRDRYNNLYYSDNTSENMNPFR